MGRVYKKEPINTIQMIKYVSFDLDDTLTDMKAFDKVMWNVEIPKLYAEKHHLSIEEAEKEVFSEYYKALYVNKIDNWTSLTMWFKKFGLDDWEGFLEDMGEKLSVFDDVFPILEQLSQKYELVMYSANDPRLLKFKLEKTGLKKYFTEVFSSEDGKSNIKGAEGLQFMLSKLGCEPSEIVHIGDNPVSDYDAPRSLGVATVLLDRKRKREGDHVIHSLAELPDKIADLNKNRSSHNMRTYC